MTKETFYFPHDYNAQEDEKILRLLSVLGWEGYGIYWGLIEKIASSSDARLKISDLEFIAFGMRTQCERITDVVRTYGLFEIEGGYFWSKRLVRHFQEVAEKSDKARKSAKVRWASVASTSDSECERNANGYANASKNDAIKEKKRNEMKENETISKEINKEKINLPTPTEIMNDFKISFIKKDDRYKTLVEAIAKRFQIPEEKINYEIEKFLNYWTEKTPNGKKELWQTKKTFEVQRRLTTWFMNSQKYSDSKKQRGGIAFIS